MIWRIEGRVKRFLKAIDDSLKGESIELELQGCCVEIVISKSEPEQSDRNF
jgi:hypothetical protein